MADLVTQEAERCNGKDTDCDLVTQEAEKCNGKDTVNIYCQQMTLPVRLLLKVLLMFHPVLMILMPLHMD